MNGQSAGQVALLALGRLFQTIFPHDRKVKNYLDNASQDSILEDLLQVLRPELRGNEITLSKLFGEFCIQYPDTQAKYWSGDCLRSYIRTAYDSSVLSDHTIRLLWRSFSYYAYHPFPCGDIDQTRVDENAFQRAVLFLALQANDLLGTQEGDWFWRNDDKYFHRKSWERMLRSIALPCAVEADEKRSERDVSEAMVSDIMDVLSMTQPQRGLPNSPSPEQLEPAARRFHADDSHDTRGARYIARATKADVWDLVEVLMRLRLGDERWGRFFHVGNLGVSSDCGVELAKTLVNNSLSPGPQEGGEDDILTSDDIIKLMDHLPNLHLRFLQLWGMIFQPQVQTSKPMSEPETTSGVPNLELLLGALSLFIPQVATSARYGERLAMQDTRIAFSETSTSMTADDTALSLTYFVQSLSEKAIKSDDPRSYIALFTNSDTTSNQETSVSYPVLGTYFPSPLFSTDEGTGKTLYSLGTGSSSDIMLFQLWPELRVARWRGEGLTLVEMLSCADPARSVEVTEQSLARIAMGSSNDEGNALSDISYWIGQQHSDSDVIETNRTGLRINPTQQTVTLLLKPYSENKFGFEQVSGSSSSEACEITVSGAVMHVSTVSGGAIVGAKKELPVVQDLSRYIRDERALRVDGQELKARIEGFGSG